MANEPLLEISVVARRLSCSESHVRRLIVKKKLPAIVIGERQYRVELSALTAFIEARRTTSHAADR